MCAVETLAVGHFPRREVGLMEKRRMLRFVLCLIVIVKIMLYIAPQAY